jgi:hypothetical protein
MKIIKVLALLCFFAATIAPHQQLKGMQIAQEAPAYAKICAGTIGTACLYGIANDQVTARICPEYFTQGFHKQRISGMKNGFLKKALSSQSPTTLGFSWGVYATWWMGALMSLPIVAASRLGSSPKLNWQQLVKPAATALAFMGVSSAMAGLVGYKKARSQTNPLNTSEALNIPFFPIHQTEYLPTIMQDVPAEKTNLFIADACAHNVAYTSGILAGLGVTGWAVYQRLTMHK